MRQIGVSYSGFVDESYTLLSLFDDVEQIEKDNRLQTAIDVVREQFGFLAIQKGTVLTEGSRNIERSKLIGGHSAGGLEGLKWIKKKIQYNFQKSVAKDVMILKCLKEFNMESLKQQLQNFVRENSKQLKYRYD